MLLLSGLVLGAAGPALDAPLGGGVEAVPPSAAWRPDAGAQAAPAGGQAAPARGIGRLIRAGIDLAREEPAAFFALFVAGIVLFAPGSAFTLAAGVAYGVWLGLALSVAATLAAAVIHFTVARHLFRGPVRRRLQDRRRFEALDRAVAREGWKIVGLTRVSALIPGAIQNLLYALTGVRLRTFVVASLAGLIPPTLLFSAAGSTGRHLLSIGDATGAVTAGAPSLSVQVVSLVVLAVAVGHVVRAARRELARAD